MSQKATHDIISKYLAAFNASDSEAMLALLHEDVAHDINQGERQIGKEQFRIFNGDMARHYKEELADIVIMVDEGGVHAAAEFTVRGQYIATAEGLPEADGQNYDIPAGIFFDVDDGMITRVTTYYNLKDWIAQVLETMDAKLEIRLIEREDFHRYIDEIARLRIAVFREWPYLYDGDMAYERQYLRVYLKAQRACIAGAFSGDDIVGVSTGVPLADHDEAFAKPLAAAGYETEKIFYFAESVLLPLYRGFGAGRGFEFREAAARRQNFAKAVFSAVIRPQDALEKPDTYVPLDKFWHRIGFQKLDNIETSFSWKDIGSDQETHKPMAFWMKNLI